MSAAAPSPIRVPSAPPPPVSNEAAIALVESLVRTPSVSGEEHAAVHLFARHAARLGFRTEIDAAGNGIAARGEPSTEILLLGHIDTVPGDIPVRTESGILYGRGSVDAKGPLAAMLVAASRAHLPTGVGVRVVAAVGEETPHSPGARFLARGPAPAPAACIIGEPSGADSVTLGYKGRLVMHANFTQDTGHSAGPHGSAGDSAFAAWTQCLAMVTTLNTGHTGAFETIQATLRTIASTSDGLTDTCTLSAGFRLPSWMPPTTMQEHLTATLGASAVRFEGHEHAHQSPRNDAVARALSTAIREAGMRPQPKLKTGTSDMNVVAPVWNCPIAAYGPGDSALDHTPHEHLRLDEYLRSVNVLTRAIELLAAELVATPHASGIAHVQHN